MKIEGITAVITADLGMMTTFGCGLPLFAQIVHTSHGVRVSIMGMCTTSIRSTMAVSGVSGRRTETAILAQL